MRELYLEVFTDVDDDGTCFVPLETAIALFVLIYCDYPPILLTFVNANRSDEAQKVGIRIEIAKFLFEVIDEKDLEGAAAACKLPAIVVCEGTTVVAGLCAVLRQVVKVVDPLHPLLGFKQGCLYACAEVSQWTKFCEVDMIDTVNRLRERERFHLKGSRVEIPRDVARFEIHMSRPVKIHNIQKKRQNLAKMNGRRDGEAFELEHAYVEGPDMTLADLILAPCFFVIFKILGSVFLKDHLPLSHRWYDKMTEKKTVSKALKLFAGIENNFEKSDVEIEYVWPEDMTFESLYKGKTAKGTRSFTNQDEISDCFEIVSELKDQIDVKPRTFGHEIHFDWSAVPWDFRCPEGQIPPKRLERKGQQLENMAKAVLKIAKDGDEIVDFCSGSGHLGLLIAHALPRCRVVLLENKEQSLKRAMETAANLRLSNVVFCQSNVDYFVGGFDVGVSLHACGVATDLVMEKCISRRASFICCPCCYGSIRANHVIEYPRSEVFRNSRMTLDRYLVLGHSSDQTHDEGNAKTGQGNRCMAAVDSDRCLRAREAGYRVFLSKLDPPSCTPKNNLLVGVPLERDEKFFFAE